mmetsp:Transcript_31845/g.62197  ORF Transcript_31845/g.62197 Transcript_31845/m.62197 type:complete len:210 (-) Transcript_31845:2321-2950(-)
MESFRAFFACRSAICWSTEAPSASRTETICCTGSASNSANVLAGSVELSCHQPSKLMTMLSAHFFACCSCIPAALLCSAGVISLRVADTQVRSFSTPCSPCPSRTCEMISSFFSSSCLDSGDSNGVRTGASVWQTRIIAATPQQAASLTSVTGESVSRLTRRAMNHSIPPGLLSELQCLPAPDSTANQSSRICSPLVLLVEDEVEALLM